MKENKRVIAIDPGFERLGIAIIDSSPKDRRVILLSNYDGSFENYIGAFIDLASEFINAIWGNADGFPRTKWLITRGCKREELFRQWMRKYQVPTQIWYSAYPRVTLPNVISNYKFRNGIEGEMTEDQAAAWLDYL